MHNQYSNGYKISQEELEVFLVLLELDFVDLAANQNVAPTPEPRQSITIEDWRRYAEAHGVPLWAAGNELHRAATAVTEPTPELDVPCDLRTGDPEAPAAARHLANFRPRRSVAKDQRSATKTAACFEEELAKLGRPSVRKPLPSTTSPKTITKAPKKSTKTPHHDNENVPAWKETKGFGKYVGMNRAVALNDNAEPYAWTLNLSPDIIARGLASKGSGFASWMQKRIQHELTKVFAYPIPFVFAVDVTRTGRPHLHGLTACTDNQCPAFEAALRHAGGAWKAKYANRQVDTRFAWHTDGWASYSARNAAAARKVVGNGVFAASASVKRDAKSLHERLRKLANAA